MPKFESNVAIVKTYPNSDPEIIDFYIKKGYRGIIVEGTGLGTVPGSQKHPSFPWLENIGKEQLENRNDCRYNITMPLREGK